MEKYDFLKFWMCIQACRNCKKFRRANNNGAFLLYYIMLSFIFIYQIIMKSTPKFQLCPSQKNILLHFFILGNLKISQILKSESGKKVITNQVRHCFLIRLMLIRYIKISKYSERNIQQFINKSTNIKQKISLKTQFST